MRISFTWLPLSITLFLGNACGDDPKEMSKDAAADAPGTTAGSDGDGGLGDALAGRQPVSITFVARVGSEPFSCASTYTGLGADNSEVKPADLRFYVQDVALVGERGEYVPVALTADGRWQQQNVALLDFEDKKDACANGTEQTNETLTGTVPVGRYRGLRFTIGVPFELNHRPLTASKAPLDLTSLFWSWNSGHLFFKAEASALVTSTGMQADGGNPGGGHGSTVDAGTMIADAGSGHGGHMNSAGASSGPRRNVFALHVGSTLCEGKATEGTLIACQHPNRGTVELTAFDPASSRVVVDFAQVFKQSRLQALPGCHSFAGGESCVAPFDSLGVDWITGRATPSTQTVFKVE